MSREAPSSIPSRAALRAYLNYDVDRNTGCYISRYSVASHGYAQVGWQDDVKNYGTTAHRAAWVNANGQIPAGMTIDHLCKNRRCVRVEHLRMLSNFENARRTDGRDWPLGECINGHPNSELVPASRGRVECRLCKAEWGARYRSANKEKVLLRSRNYYRRNLEASRRRGRNNYHVSKYLAKNAGF